VIISSIDVFGYDVTYVHGQYVMSRGRVITSLPSTVVRLTTKDGRAGWGEVCPLGTTYLPSFGAGARAALQQIAPHLVGIDAANPARVRQAMDDALMGHDYAKSAVDIACWDLLGQAAGLSVSTLLGGQIQPSYPLYIAVPLDEPPRMKDYVLARKAEGIRRFQLKIGGAPGDDAARARAVVDATSDGDTVIADANGGWRAQDAGVAARMLEDLPRTYLEQPCPTLEECLYVRERTTLPMVLDEVITDVHAFLRAWHAGGMDAINLKISRVGGLTKAKQIRDLAQTLGIRLTIEDTWGGDVTTAAISHLAASTTREALFTVSFMNTWVNEHIAGGEPRVQAGMGIAPTGPGLGITVDAARLGAPLFSAA